jgi:hypothetical protein
MNPAIWFASIDLAGLTQTFVSDTDYSLYFVTTT